VSGSAKPASPASTGAPTANTAPAPLLSELPVDIRGQIPPLAISGSVYSDNPSQRLLLINGLVLPQGSQVAPDVTLVEILRGSSEFTFRGTRFRLAH
jgi:general secretion pathway protein B